MMVESSGTEWSSSVLESKSQTERKAHLELLTRNLAAMEQQVKTVRESVFIEGVVEKDKESDNKTENITASKHCFHPVVSFDENDGKEEIVNQENESLQSEATDSLLSSTSSRVVGVVVSTEHEEEITITPPPPPRPFPDDVLKSIEQSTILKEDKSEIHPRMQGNETTVRAITTTNEETLNFKNTSLIAEEEEEEEEHNEDKPKIKKSRVTRMGDRSGKWTTEEEEYARYVIECFDKGILRGPEKGTSLRSYLAKVLNCDPMRISKKYVGMMRIGKRFFRKSLTYDAEARTEIAARNLEVLRRRWEMREQYRAEDRMASLSGLFRDGGDLAPMSLSLAPRYDTFNNAHLAHLPFLSQKPYWATNLQNGRNPPQHHPHLAMNSDLLLPQSSMGRYYPPPPPSSFPPSLQHYHHMPMNTSPSFMSTRPSPPQRFMGPNNDSQYFNGYGAGQLQRGSFDHLDVSTNDIYNTNGQFNHPSYSFSGPSNPHYQPFQGPNGHHHGMYREKNDKSDEPYLSGNSIPFSSQQLSFMQQMHQQMHRIQDGSSSSSSSSNDNDRFSDRQLANPNPTVKSSEADDDDNYGTAKVDEHTRNNDDEGLKNAKEGSNEFENQEEKTNDMMNCLTPLAVAAAAVQAAEASAQLLQQHE